MKIYFGKLLVKQRCFYLPYGCLISFVTHYYCLSSCAASSASLSLFVSSSAHCDLLTTWLSFLLMNLLCNPYKTQRVSLDGCRMYVFLA